MREVKRIGQITEEVRDTAVFCCRKDTGQRRGEAESRDMEPGAPDRSRIVEPPRRHRRHDKEDNRGSNPIGAIDTASPPCGRAGKKPGSTGRKDKTTFYRRGLPARLLTVQMPARRVKR